MTDDRQPHHLEEMIGDYLKRLEREQRDKFYRLGLEAAARMAENWAEQCAGGSGSYGDGYRNLAKAQRRIDPAKGY